MKEFFFDLQRFATTTSNTDNGDDTLEESKNILKKLADYTSNGFKVYSFVTKLIENIKIANSGFPITENHNHLWYVLSKFNEIGAITVTSLKTGKLSKASFSAMQSRFSEAMKDLTKLTATKDPMPFMLIIAMSLHLKNVIGTLDGHELSDKEKKELNLSFANVTKESIKLLAKIMSAETKLTLTMPVSVVDFVVSAVTGVVSGIFQAIESAEKYNEDGLPDKLAFKETIIDAIVTTVHEFYTTLTGGADDVAFKFILWLVSKVPGVEITDKDKDKNYVELAGEVFKRLNINNRGDSGDNLLISEKNDTVVYGDDGNDYIRNFVSNVQLLGGHDDDTIFSHKGAQKNSILGGPGKDFILAYDNNSAIYGCANNSNYDGDDNDKIAVYGNKNKIYGESGNDAIFLTNDANGNTINGGLGDDIIILDNSKNSVIEYNDGDGNDEVYLYSEKDKLQIHGSYSTQISGKNVYIDVGEGRIVLNNAVGLTIDINGKKISTMNDSTSGNVTLTPIEFPSFWEDNVYITRGTAKNDTISVYSKKIINTGDGNDLINNCAEKVTINSGNDDDTVVNYGNNIVSINGGDGNDKIFNGGLYDGWNWCDGGSSVTIDGGAGNDSIENWGFYVVYKAEYDYYSSEHSKINGGDGDDHIYSHGKYSTLWGGNGNDTIVNNGFDYYDAYAHYSSIYGGNGNDSIENKYASWVMIDAGNGNDTINNSKVGLSTILGGDGDDFINSKTGDYIGNLIDSGDGNDTINNTGKNLTIYGGLGDDSIYNNGDNSSISGGVDNDKITNYGSEVTITSGDGNDYIYNDDSSSLTAIKGDTGNDSIENYGVNVTIDGGDGNDTIYNGCYEYNGTIRYSDDNYGSNVLFKYNAGDGDDIIYGFKADSTLQIGEGTGTYSTTKSGSDLIIKVGDGKISLVGTASLSGLQINGIKVNPKDVRGTAEADSIINSIEGATIQAFDGDNKINNMGMSVSIIAGTGKDSIINSADNVTISSGSGNDSIENATNRKCEAKNVSIFSGAGNDFIKNKANGLNSRIFAGADDDKVVNYGLSSTIDGGSGDDDLYNHSKNVSINGDKGNDTIYSGGSYSTLKGGVGNDSIRNDFGKDILIDGGEDADTITNLSGSNTTIFGGEGNDSILNNESNDVTINGGKGDDYIGNKLSKNVLFHYVSGDGNDTIEYFDSTSTLSISDCFYSSSKSGSDIIVTVGKDKITLIDAASLSSFNIIGKKIPETETTLTVTDKIKSPVTVSSDIQTINASKRTKAVKITANDLDNSINGSSANDSLYGGAGNDSILGNAGNDKLFGQDGDDSLSGGNGNDTLTGGNGNDVFIYSAGKDVIADYATGDIISLGSAVSKSSISGSDIVFTIGKGSLTVKNAKGKSLSMIDSKGNNFSTILGGSTTSTLLTVTDKTKSPVTVGSSIQTINASKRTKAVKITANELDNTINGGSAADTILGANGDDYISGGKGNDKLYGELGNDTLRGNAGNDTLYGGDGSDLFICGSGKEIITDYSSDDKISLASAITKTSVSGSDVILTMGSNSLTLKNAKDKSLYLIDSKGNNFSTILGGSTTSTLLTITDKTKSPVTVGSSIQTINASKRTKAVKITANELDNSINGSSANDSLYGGAGNDSILGNAGNDKLFGQDGADTLRGGNGNDTLTGGNGNDVFIYSAGKDVIADYASGDKISLGAAVSKASISGSDVVFTIGKGSLKVKNGKGNSLAMINSSGNSFSTIIGGSMTSTLLTVTNSTKSPVTAGSAVKTINASKRTTAVKITGNSLANTISGGSSKDSLYGDAGNDKLYGQTGNDILHGGKGNDSLWGGAGNDKLYGGTGDDILTGGKGNDSLWGNAGADTFIYASGDGKDVIYGFENDDILKITGTFSASYNKSKKEIAFKVSSTANAITLKDFSATSFNLNGTNYKISDKTLKK